MVLMKIPSREIGAKRRFCGSGSLSRFGGRDGG